MRATKAIHISITHMGCLQCISAIHMCVNIYIYIIYIGYVHIRYKKGVHMYILYTHKCFF